MGKKELVALLNLSSWCLVMVERLFLAVPWGCLQFVIVVFPDHTHLLFCTKHMGRFYYNSNRFLMLCVQNVCVEPILISLNPILTEFVMMLVSPPHRHPPINAN